MTIIVASSSEHIPAVGLVREENSWLLAQEVNFSFLQGDINIWS